MVMANGLLAAGTPLAPALSGLVGAVIGAAVAGVVSLRVASQTREAAEHAWIRDNRREIYDRFLTYAQQLLIASEAYYDARRKDDKARAKVESAFDSFWEVYGVVQTVADIQLFRKARIYGYRLWELATSLGSTSVMGPKWFPKVSELVRSARHDTIIEMRAELGLSGKVRRFGRGAAPRKGAHTVDSTDLDSDINPFEGTGHLEDEYAKGQLKRRRPGRLELKGDGRESMAHNFAAYLRKLSETGNEVISAK
jgi:hypothetical protein